MRVFAEKVSLCVLIFAIPGVFAGGLCLLEPAERTQAAVLIGVSLACLVVSGLSAVLLHQGDSRC